MGNFVKIIVVSQTCQPLTQAMYGWSKYGGANQGLVGENIDEIWTCQACGKSQKDPNPFEFEFAPREFIKICSNCHNISVSHELTCLQDLLSEVRKFHGYF